MYFFQTNDIGYAANLFSESIKNKEKIDYKVYENEILSFLHKHLFIGSYHGKFINSFVIHFFSLFKNIDLSRNMFCRYMTLAVKQSDRYAYSDVIKNFFKIFSQPREENPLFFKKQSLENAAKLFHECFLYHGFPSRHIEARKENLKDLAVFINIVIENFIKENNFKPIQVIYFLIHNFEEIDRCDILAEQLDEDNLYIYLKEVLENILEKNLNPIKSIAKSYLTSIDSLYEPLIDLGMESLKGLKIYEKLYGEDYYE